MSTTYSYPLPRFAIKPQTRSAPVHSPQRLVLGLLWINVALGAFVVVEPAPYDIAILTVLALALCTQSIQVSRHVLVAGSALLLFLVASSILIAPPMEWDRWIEHSRATLLLSCSWFLFAGITNRNGARGAHLILGAYTAAAVVAALAALAGYFDLIPGLHSIVVMGDRARSFFKDPNVFGPFLLAPTLTCAMWIQNKSFNTLQRVLTAIAGTIMLAAVFLTYSRAAYATTIFAMLAYAIFTGVLRSWRSFLWLILAVGCAALLLSFVPNATEFLGQRLEAHSYDQDRFHVFELAFGLGIGNLLGVGAGQSHYILGYGVHSMYLRLFADHGAPGFAAFLVFIFLCVARMTAQIRRAQKPREQALAALVLAATLGTLLNGFVIETIHWRHLWLLLGLCWYSFPEQFRHSSPVAWNRRGARTH